LQDITGIRMQHIPLWRWRSGDRRGAARRGAVAAGRLARGWPADREWRCRALAIAAEQRTPALPDIPTFREQGIDYLTGTWFGLLAPAKTPLGSSPCSTRMFIGAGAATA